MKNTYVVNSKAWYMQSGPNKEMFEKDRIVEELNIQCSKGDDSYEFSVTWYSIGDLISPKISLFDDSWLAFIQFPKLFQAFSFLHGMNPTPKEIIGLLDGLGFKEKTETKQPK
jgi:hypothetical protein